jgi:hypothetical protein
MHHPDFRVSNKIFATMGYPRRGWAMIKLTPDEQTAFVQMKPAAFVPVPGKWGARGCTNVVLARATIAPVRAALRAAHDTVVASNGTRPRRSRGRAA